MADVAALNVVTPNRNAGAKTLGAATMLWFIMTLIGQWVFLYYIAAFYGTPALSGDFAAWNRHPMIDRPFRPHDIAATIAFGAHVTLALIIVFGGTLQLVPQIRQRAAVLHRWNGRVFIVAAMLAALAGLYMVWIRGGASGGSINNFIISGNAVLVLAFAVLAWRAGAARNIASHRRWALRTFMVTNGVFWLRLAFSAWIILTRAQPSALTFYIFAAASYLVPLLLLELYFAAKDSGGPARLAMAGVVFAATAYIALGIFGFSMIFVGAILSA
jgi:uncharacterized membrane protein